VVAGWTWVRPSITLSPRISAAFRPYWGGDVHGLDKLITADLRVTWAWELRRCAIELGFAVGGGWNIRPDGNDPRVVETFVHGVVHADATLGASLPLWGRSYLGAELAVQTHLVHTEDPLVNSRPETVIAINLIGGVWL
jgi:hypothetical protein